MSDNRDPGNSNRIDLYRYLLDQVKNMDQLSGTQGFVYHWDDPDFTWDSLDTFWDKIGLSPVIQELFFVIEKMCGEDLQALEDVMAVVDPVRAPEAWLSRIAASFGYQLDEGITVEKKRAVLLGLINLFKQRGTRLSFEAFFRITGFTMIDVYPLFKKAINEANDNYNRVRYSTTQVLNETVGALGAASYAGVLARPAIRPGTIVIRIAPQGVAVKELVGSTNIAGIDALSPTEGDAYVLTDAGTPAAGTSDALVAGSIAEFDGTSWIEIVAGSGGFVPVDTKALASYQTALNGTLGLADTVDDGSILDWDGTSLTPSIITAAVNDDMVRVSGVGSIDVGNEYRHAGTTPTGSWDLALVPIGSFYRDAPAAVPSSQNDIHTLGSFISAPGANQILVTSFVNYSTGDFQVNFTAATVGAVTLSYEHIDEEWPYFAARVDVEVRLSPVPNVFPAIDDTLAKGMLSRIEEVRPIHVLLRAFAIVVELADTVQPTASDAHGFVRHAWGECWLTIFTIADVGPDASTDSIYEDVADTTRRFAVIREKIDADGNTELTTVQVAGSTQPDATGTLDLFAGTGDASIAWTVVRFVTRQKHYLLDVGTLADDGVMVINESSPQRTTLHLEERAPIVSIMDYADVLYAGSNQRV